MDTVTPERRRALDERNDAILAMSREGKSLKEIAQHFGVCIATVSNVRHKYGFTIYAKPDPQRIRELTARGFSVDEIVATLGCSERTVSRIRNDLGCLVARPSIPLSEDEKLRAKMFLEDGCSYSEVAKTLGRSITVIEHHFPGMGWTKQQAIEYSRLEKRFRRLCRDC